MGRFRQTVLEKRWHRLVPAAVLLILTALSLALWWREHNLTGELELREFNHRKAAILSDVLDRLGRIKDLAWTTRSEFTVNPSDSPDHLNGFIERLDIARRFPGVEAINLIRFVRHRDLTSFVETRRRDESGFTVFPPGDRPDYMVVSLALFPDQAKMTGYDAGSDSGLREAMNAARDSGRATFSGKIGKRTDGEMVAYLPIYAEGLPTRTVEERRTAIRGWAGVGFSMKRLLEGLRAPDEKIDLEVYDGAASQDNLLLDLDQARFAGLGGKRRYEDHEVIDIGGRSFTVYIASSSEGKSLSQGVPPLMAGVTLASLALLFLTQYLGSTLRQKEERLRLVLEGSNDGFWDWDIASDTVYFSPHCSEMLGYPSDRIGTDRHSWLDIVHPDDKPLIRRNFITHFHDTDQKIRQEYRLRTRDGRWLWVRETASVVLQANGRATRMCGTVSDISEYRRTGDHMRLLSKVIEESPASVIITDADGVIFYVNRTFETVSGFRHDEVYGKKPSIIASGLTPPATYDQLWSTITAGREWRGELCNRKKDGSPYWEDVFITPMKNSDDEPCYVGIKVDITEKKQIEESRIHSQKMEAIGTLAGGIAHDFNNILTSILGFNHLILGDICNPEAVTRHAHQVNLAGNRAKDLVRQILTFSRQMPTQKAAIDLCQIVTEVCQLVRTSAPAKVRICVELQPDTAIVLGTPIQLHQVVMNLCLNAIDAIDAAGGTVSVAMREEEFHYLLSVTDTGCGIPREFLSRIFDPFFTTKEGGKGDGLGLSVVNGIVEDLGGVIEVESRPRHGSSFSVRLPKHTAPAGLIGPPKEVLPASATSHDRHILVVDDDSAIVDLLTNFFERMGHRVSATILAAEARDWIFGGRRFDLVVTDQMMAEVTGLELAEIIARVAPGTFVLLCSGRDDNIDYEAVASARVDGFILKPFNLIELNDAVESLLRSGANAA